MADVLIQAKPGLPAPVVLTGAPQDGGVGSGQLSGYFPFRSCHSKAHETPFFPLEFSKNKFNDSDAPAGGLVYGFYLCSVWGCVYE